MNDDQRERVVAARQRLRQRFLSRGEPSRDDGLALGSGPPNRHGLPKVPIGQTVTEKWPVLDLGQRPYVRKSQWRLEVTGACANPQTLDFATLKALPRVDDASDLHCVTGWSKLDVRWGGVRLSDVLALAEPNDDAAFVLCHGSDGYTTNLSLADALQPDVLLVHTVNGEPLSTDHGHPVRMITPRLYAWKGAKWLCRIELLTEDQPGFWEQRGYSNTARPWRNDRYDESEPDP